MKDYIIYILEEYKNTLNNYEEYLSALPNHDILIIINLFSVIIIIGCFVSILSSFYSKFLIENFKLETKFPKLSRLIRLRQNFQHYYIIINSILIFITAIPLILIDS